MADHSAQNGTAQQHQKLAALLRECADHIERNEFHSDMYQALGLLHTYAGEHAGNPNNNTTVGSTVDDRSISPKDSGSFDQSAQHLMNSLGKKFQKGLSMATTPLVKPVTQPQAHATSQKNAERAKSEMADAFRGSSGQVKKAEVGTRHKENDWCDEHFCLGCQCKSHQQSKKEPSVGSTSPIPRAASSSPTPQSGRPDSTTTRVTVTTTTSSTPSTATTTSTKRPSNKPAFQRPVNPNSILIANGWIEQQRRSKMRIVWKDVLASLVEGRKPGEETTLWIQREVTSPLTGKAELEALHQIPIKWLTSVNYLDYSTDHRFALKVYNVAEEFTFRCADQESAQNWVLTLQSVREIAQKNAKASKMGPYSSTEASSEPEKAPEKTSHRMTISELRAIAHGAGISTAGMERRELEEAVAQIAGGAQSDTDKQEAARSAREEEVRRKQRQAEMDEQRRRGEAAAALEEKRRKQQALEEAEQRQRMAEEAERRKRVAAEEAERRMRMEEERRRKVEEEQRRRAEEERGRKLAEEERRRRQIEDERRRQAEEALRRRQAEEEALRRIQAEEEVHRRKAAEEEQRRRVAEQQAAEQRRRQEEAQRQRWQQDQQRQQQQQQQWQQQQAAEQRRRQEEAQRQRWQQQQQRPAGQPGQQPQHPGGQPGHQQQHPGGPQQQFYGPGGARPASPPRPPPPPNGTGAPTSPVNQKYAKMAAQDDDDGQAVITAIKHNILVHWALQPPRLQMLRPIDILITTIHNVFPPAFGVPGHEYFAKWKALQRESLLGPGHRPDEDKLKKSVRKLRFFLHPDKLPRDLNEEQQFMCKMLWDITSDAWEEFEKHKEELDWIRG